MPSPPATLPKELLEEIFLRFPTPADLARASAACVHFRRTIADRAFRRRFRALHSSASSTKMASDRPSRRTSSPRSPRPSPVPRTYPTRSSPASSPPSKLTGTTTPAGVPAASAMAASSSSGAPRTATSLANGDAAAPIEPGEVLSSATPAPSTASATAPGAKWNAAHFRLAVCDPLSRRYVMLPPIPEDLAAQPLERLAEFMPEDLAAQPQERLVEFMPILAPSPTPTPGNVEGEDEDEMSFKVICVVEYITKLVPFVFSSRTREWCMAEAISQTYAIRMFRFDCVHGFFYWTARHSLHMLDTHSMLSLTVNLLTGYHLWLKDLPDQNLWQHLNVIVVDTEGVLEMFTLSCEHGSFALYHTAGENNSEDWQLKNIIPLPAEYHDYCISKVGAAEVFLFLEATPQNGDHDFDCLSLEVKTYEITKVCSMAAPIYHRKQAHPYFGFQLLRPRL